ncbi:protein of unknown function (DUF4219) [Popillia japonica]|uniref:CCHC-type domain-containing protein n=1 Tax=Popillia japonica TaxID=7064 RepID=A0AAW1IFA5_POPJA
MEDDKYKIPLFDGNNYGNWKFRMETFLEAKDLLQCIKMEQDDLENNADNKKRDLKCKSQIVQSIADTHLEYIKDCKTSREIWETLNKTFERKGIKNQLYLRRKLLSMKYNDSDNLQTHFLEFDKLIRELKNCGAKLEEADVVCHLLLTLPKSFDAIVTAIDTMADDNITLNFVKSKLLDHDLKKNGNSEKISNKMTTTAFTSHSKFKYKCFSCGKIGHRKADCKFRIPKRQEQSSANKVRDNEEKKANLTVEENKVAFMVCDDEECSDSSWFLDSGATDHMVNDKQLFTSLRKLEECSDSSWFLDSGATDHMVNDKQLFTSLRKLDKPIKIAVAKQGQMLEANFVGDMEVISAVNGKNIKIPIENVLYVPNLLHNLFSVRKVEDKGMKITFFNKKLVMLTQIGEMSLIDGRLRVTYLKFMIIPFLGFHENNQLYHYTVSWVSRKQSTVSLSSTEAEYVSLCSATTEAIWLKRLLLDLGIETGIVNIYEDNMPCIAISKDPMYHKRVKHIDIKYHFIREQIENKIIEPIYISTQEQIADVLTKGLSSQKFTVFRDKLGVSSYEYFDGAGGCCSSNI